MKQFKILLLVGLLLAGGMFTGCKQDVVIADVPKVKMPNVEYGFILDSFLVERDTIERDEFLSTILDRYGVSSLRIHELSQSAKEVFPVVNLREDKPYTILSPKDTSKPAEFFIYEPNIFEFVVFDLRTDPSVEIIKRPTNMVLREGSGLIRSSLWQSMVESLDYSPHVRNNLAARMEDAFQWTVDFHHIQKNDKYKLIYEEIQIGGRAVDVGKIHAAIFESGGKPMYAFYFETDQYSGYFDETAKPMKRAFLRSPVRFARISSRYNLRRRHPILRRVKAHLGTDYAAPRGTPIHSVGNGVVTKASYTRGNGKYVKIKHNTKYATQYLHMSKFAKGIKPGRRVSQGEVIGFVGSTGLATGPHVCFRFWKNGRQVNHLRENFPPPKPMPEEYVEPYMTYKDSVRPLLDRIEYPNLVPIIDSTRLSISEPTEE